MACVQLTQDLASNNDLGARRVRVLYEHFLEDIPLTPEAAVTPVNRLIALMTLRVSKTKKVITPNGVIPAKYRHATQMNKCRSSASRMILTAALSSGSSFNHKLVGDGEGSDELEDERCDMHISAHFTLLPFVAFLCNQVQ